MQNVREKDDGKHERMADQESNKKFKDKVKG